jgi:predicted transcriptional regulator
MEGEEVWVPPILRIGHRGVRAKIWAFLYVNQSRWFTAKEISEHLDMPLSTVQVALKDLLILGPRIESRDKDRSGRGRPEKEYSFQRVIRASM